MRTVYVHIDEAGAWALTKCPCCREVHKYVLRDAADHALSCKSCGLPVDLRRAIGVEAAAEVAALALREGRAGAASLLQRPPAVAHGSLRS